MIEKYTLVTSVVLMVAVIVFVAVVSFGIHRGGFPGRIDDPIARFARFVVRAGYRSPKPPAEASVQQDVLPTSPYLPAHNGLGHVQ